VKLTGWEKKEAPNKVLLPPPKKKKIKSYVQSIVWSTMVVDGSQDFFYEIFLVCTEYGDLVRPIDFKLP